MLCKDLCPQNAISIHDTWKSYNAEIDEKKCLSCGKCYNNCQVINRVELRKTISWYQGWSRDIYIHKKASSGGAATSIASFFLERGVVYGCVFNDGRFAFERLSEISDINKMSGSKYVKSNPTGVYEKIKRDLMNGMDVLFIGLPCQVAAVKRYTGAIYDDKLYTIDLICHGTPSPDFLNAYLNQYKINLSEIKNISFRINQKMQLHVDNQGLVEKGVSDKYTIAFLEGLTYTDNCYNCSYATEKRVADITLGDSWGNKLSQIEAKEGVSLILVQTSKGNELIKNADIEKFDVDIQNAINNNLQLKRPSLEPKERNRFFDFIRNGKKINSEIFRIYTAKCLKQDIKEILIKLRLWH